jgi:hypothetical protein
MQLTLRRIRNIIISVVIFIVGFVALWGALFWLFLFGPIKNSTISYNWNYVLAAVVALIAGYYAYRAYVNLEDDRQS